MVVRAGPLQRSVLQKPTVELVATAVLGDQLVQRVQQVLQALLVQMEQLALPTQVLELSSEPQVQLV